MAGGLKREVSEVGLKSISDIVFSGYGRFQRRQNTNECTTLIIQGVDVKAKPLLFW